MTKDTITLPVIYKVAIAPTSIAKRDGVEILVTVSVIGTSKEAVDDAGAAIEALWPRTLKAWANAARVAIRAKWSKRHNPK